MGQPQHQIHRFNPKQKAQGDWVETYGDFKMLTPFNCTQCGKTNYRRKDRIKERAFCDSTCMNAYKRGGVLITKELVDELVILRNEGWQYKQLSEFFGVDRTTLWKLYEGLQAPSGRIEEI